MGRIQLSLSERVFLIEVLDWDRSVLHGRWKGSYSGFVSCDDHETIAKKKLPKELLEELAVAVDLELKKF